MLKPKRQRRKARIRAKLRGSADRPRVCVYRSNKYFYAQIIDDQKAHTLGQTQGSDPKKVAQELLEIFKTKKIKQAVFDRSGYKYHGKVRIFVEALREGGLKI